VEQERLRMVEEKLRLEQDFAATKLQTSVRTSSAKAEAGRRREEKMRVEQERLRIKEERLRLEQEKLSIKKDLAAIKLQASLRQSSAKAEASRRREEKLRLNEEELRMDQEAAATTLQRSARGLSARNDVKTRCAAVFPEPTDDGIYVPWLKNADSSGVHTPDAVSRRDSANADALDDASEDLDPEEAWEAEADELVKTKSIKPEVANHNGIEPLSLGELTEPTLQTNVQESAPSPNSKNGSARGLTWRSDEDSHLNSVWDSEASVAEGATPLLDENVPLPPGIPNSVRARIPAHVMVTVLRLQRSFRNCIANKKAQAQLEASKTRLHSEDKANFATSGFTIGPRRLTLDSIKSVFEEFDKEKSDGLDTFDLFDALEKLWGQQPTTAQVTAMIESLGAYETNRLTLEQFLEAQSTDWSDIPSDGFDDFEITFSKASLGFDIWFDEQSEHIEVNNVLDPDVKGELAAGDTITAVNGAPLGLVNHPKLLQEKVKNLKRPLRIAFMRPLIKKVAQVDEIGENIPVEHLMEANSGAKVDDSNVEAIIEPSPDATVDVASSTADKIKVVFSSFDKNDSGELDTFNLGHAIQAIRGQLPSTPQIMAMIETLKVFETGKVTFQQFIDVLATDWSSITTADGIEDAYVVSVEKDELGFDVSFDELNGRLTIVEVVDSDLRSQVTVNDVLLAINGVPLGFISDLSAVRKKIKGARRPVRITFFRRDALDKVSEGPGQLPDLPVLQSASESTTKVAAHSAVTTPQAFESASEKTNEVGAQPASEMTNKLAAQARVTTLQVPDPASETTNKVAAQSTVTNLNQSEIEAIFKRFDWDESGKLDSFELSRAIEVAWGRAPTMTQVLAMIDGVSGDFSLSLEQFTNVLKTDWSTVSEPEEIDVAFDVLFSNDALGFEVAFDETSGEIYVDSITDSDLIGRLDIGDTVLAVDSVPLGAVSNPSVLTERVKSAKRPFQITFYKN